MKCPLCSGQLERINLLTISGDTLDTQKCSQCRGIWFPQSLKQQLDLRSVHEYDPPSPNYSMKPYDIVCSFDGTLMKESDHSSSPHAGKYYQCPDCEGMFFPQGQLALYQEWISDQHQSLAIAQTGISRQGALTGILSLFVLTAAFLASVSQVDVSLQASQTQTLPNSGPNILTLSMLAIAYISGTVLAVLGRRLPIIFMGWGVIAICLFGFSIIIFGP